MILTLYEYSFETFILKEMSTPTGGRIAIMARRVTNLTVTVDRNGQRAMVAFPGLTMDDINRCGKVGISRILHWFTSARILAYHIPNKQTGTTFLEYDKMTNSYFTFMASAKATVEKEFYNLVHSSSLMPQLDLELHLGYVGTSSLNSFTTLYNHSTGEKLAHNVNQVVLIDAVKRSPTTIPEWWRKKYEQYVVENERLIVKKLQVPTENTHKYELTVVWSDTDAYKHTNYASYVKFCLDAATDAIDKEVYSGFHNDILQYDVKSIENLYAGECKACDKLVITTWQDDKNPLVLYFSISKQEGATADPTNNKLVFQSTMEFHSPI